MRLSEAIRMRSPFSLALTGAGGKSSALFQLGRDLLEQGTIQNCNDPSARHCCAFGDDPPGS